MMITATALATQWEQLINLLMLLMSVQSLETSQRLLVVVAQ